MGAIVAAVTTLVAPATVAHADQGDTLKGGCSFDTDQQATVTNGQNQGIIDDLSVSQEASGGPSGATVQCWIDVNGVQAPGTRITASGNGVQSNLAQISFTAVDGDTISLCQQVTFDDGSSWVGPNGTNPDCPAATTLIFPPPVLTDSLNTLGGLVGPVDAGLIGGDPYLQRCQIEFVEPPVGIGPPPPGATIEAQAVGVVIGTDVLATDVVCDIFQDGVNQLHIDSTFQRGNAAVGTGAFVEKNTDPLTECVQVSYFNGTTQYGPYLCQLLPTGPMVMSQGTFPPL